MHPILDGFLLRKPEPADVEALYRQKNDPEVGALLGGFTSGYSRRDLEGWVEHHRTHRSEVLWVIAESDGDRAVGHVGLYEIDHRIRTAEFAIMLGDKSVWGKGLGRACTAFVVRYGFEQLNLNRVSLQVLETNTRAQQLYKSLGFVEEGRLRQAQYKSGRYLDVLVMSILRTEHRADDL
jgi:ribosomal-protein-alanine N-acetyltransferase